MDIQYQQVKQEGKPLGGHLWSLWDMLKLYALQFVALGVEMCQMRTILMLDEGNESRTEQEIAESRSLLDSHLKRLSEICKQLDLSTAIAMVKSAQSDPPQTKRELDQLLRVIDKEMQGQLFFHVPAHRARYFNSYDDPDAQAIPGFPNASKELQRAHNCYVFGEYTSSVFHAMRATEIALRSVSKSLTGVTLPSPLEAAEWQTLINCIDTHTKALLQTTKTAKRDEDLKFYSDASSQFTNFKEAFRKHVAHARDSYEEIPSMSILHRTREFLETLSKRVTE
jgi:hypothetical protein